MNFILQVFNELFIIFIYVIIFLIKRKRTASKENNEAFYSM